MHSSIVHYSVLLEESLAMLDLSHARVVVDATLGQGGHTEAILERSEATVVALDADPSSIEVARSRLSRFASRLTLVESNFAQVGEVLAQRGLAGQVDATLFDLGWNRAQLGSGRGFSFLVDEPLNMSYGPIPASGFTAAEIVNTWDEAVIADVLYGYGEERYARRIARAIIEARAKSAITTSLHLAQIVASTVPTRHGKTHPATKTFQALRIAVNDEFTVIEKGVEAAYRSLAPGGRLAVISFHSSEDRIIKRLFASYIAQGAIAQSKKPVTPTESELRANPSSRSAKLRGIIK